MFKILNFEKSCFDKFLKIIYHEPSDNKPKFSIIFGQNWAKTRTMKKCVIYGCSYPTLLQSLPTGGHDQFEAIYRKQCDKFAVLEYDLLL